jgi:hypothetical protein
MARPRRSTSPLVLLLGVAACGGTPGTPVESPDGSDSGRDDAGGLDASAASDGGSDAASQADAPPTSDADSADAADAADGSVSLDAAADAATDADDAGLTCGSAAGTAVTTLAELQALAGCVTLTGDLTLAVSVSDYSLLQSLQHVTGSLSMSGASSLHGLESLATVGGTLTFGSGFANTDPLVGLTSVGVEVTNDAAASVTSIHLPALVHTPLFDASNSSSLTDVNLPALTDAAVAISDNSALQSISLGALKHSASIQIVGAAAAPFPATTFSVPSLATVDGDVTITGLTLTSLPALSALTSVGGTLTLGDIPSLADIDGLGSLTQVGGLLSVTECPALASIEGLHSVTSLGGLNLKDLTVLPSVEGLRALTTIGINSGSADLGTYFVNLGPLPALTDLTGLRSLTTVYQTLGIGPIGTTNLHGLEALTSVGLDLVITGNTQMQSMTGLDGLKSVGQMIQITGNTVTSIGSLNALTSVGTQGILIENNSALVSLSGFRGLATLDGSVTIDNNTALTSIDGFDALQSADTIDLYDNKLSTVNGFGSLTTLTQNLTVEEGPLLTTLAAFQKLTQVGGDLQVVGRLASYSELGALESTGGSLYLDSGDVTTLSDFASLTKVGATLAASGQPNLTSVNVLPRLTSVGALVFVDDPLLPACDAQNLVTALQADGFTGSVTISNDGSGTCP